MSTNASQIVTLTQECTTLLSDLIRNLVNSPEQAWVEVQLQRLNLWAKFLGVFAEGQLSINHRLAKNKQVKNVVIQLLSALRGNLVLYYPLVTKKDCPVKLTKPVHEAAGSSSESDTTESSDEEETPAARVEARKCKIRDGLGRLGQLAVRLRRDGAQRSAAAAMSYEPVDDAHNKLAPAFDEYIRATLKRAFDPLLEVRQYTNEPTMKPIWPVAQPDEPIGDRSLTHQVYANKEPHFPLPDYLRERLRLTIMQRWRRICYQRHHASGLAGPVAQPTKDLELQDVSAEPPAPASKVGRETIRPLDGSAKQSLEPTTTKRPFSVATVTSERIVINAVSDLEPQPSKTITTKVRAGDLNYPRAPVVNRGLEWFDCPFCGQPQPSSMLNTTKAWQLHVMQDLAPYFCLMEQCTTSLRLYSKSDDWLDHMRAEHSKERWSCHACQDKEAVTFNHADEYEQHLRRQHADQDLSSESVALLVKHGCQNTAPLHPNCLFCGFIPEAYINHWQTNECQQEIVSHISKHHLQLFALASMPWDVAGVSGGSSCQPTHTTDSGSDSAKRSIMQNADLVIYAPSTSEQQALDQEPSLRIQYQQAREDVYSASLDEIRRRLDGTRGEQEIVDKWLQDLDSGELTSSENGADRPEPPVKGIAHVLSAKSDSLTAILTNDTVDASDDEDKEEDPDAGDSAAVATSELLTLARTGDEEKLRQYLESVYDIKTLSPKSSATFDLNSQAGTDKDGNSPMHLAVLARSPACIKLLADWKCNLDKIRPSVGTPLSLATRMQDIQLVKMLLDCGAATDLPQHVHAPPLHIACALGSYELAQMLLVYGAYVNHIAFFQFGPLRGEQSKTTDGLNPGDLTLPEGDSSLTRKQPLIFMEGGPPVFMAILYGHKRLIKLLVDYGADLNRRARFDGMLDRDKPEKGSYDQGSDVPLTLCAAEDRHDMVKYLLQLGAETLCTDNTGHDAIGNAAKFDSLESLVILAKHIDAYMYEDKQRILEQALFRTAECGSLKCLVYLLDIGVTIDATSSTHENAFRLACLHNHLKIAELLQSRGASMSGLDENGNKPLSIACYNGHVDITKFLLSHGADINFQAKYGYTALMHACSPKDATCLDILLEHGADVHLYNVQTRTALHLCALKGRAQHSSKLIDKGAAVDCRNHWGRTPLIEAAGKGNEETLRVLLERGADANAQDSHSRDTALTLAVHHGFQNVVEALLEHGADTEIQNINGFTALFIACTAGRVKLLQLLINHNASMTVEDETGATPLSSTVEKGHSQCLQLLLEAGLKPENPHAWDPSVVLAARRGNLSCLRLLLTVSSPDATDENGATALMAATNAGHIDCVEALLEANASVNLRNDYTGMTALHLAAMSGSRQSLCLLLEHKADVDVQNQRGQTALMTAIEVCKKPDAVIDCAEVLLNHGASLEIQSRSGHSAIHYAAMYAEDNIVSLLAARNANIDLADNEGITPLMCAAGSGHLATVEILMKLGASIEFTSPDTGMTALSYAILRRHSSISIVSLLLKRDAPLGLPKHDTLLLRDIEFELRSCYELVGGGRERSKIVYCLSVVVLAISARRVAGDTEAIFADWVLDRLRAKARLARERKSGRKQVKFATVMTPEDMKQDGAAITDEDETPGPQVRALREEGVNVVQPEISSLEV